MEQLELRDNLERFARMAARQARVTRLLLNGNQRTLDLLQTVDKSNLVNAINEVLALAITQSPGGEVDLADIDRAVNDYFVLHPQSFTYDKITADTTWNITHPLDHRPNVVVTDSANTVWVGQVSYPAQNQVRLQFNFPISGRAVLT